MEIEVFYGGPQGPSGGGTSDLPDAEAENDVVMATAALAWIRKSIADLKTALGLGTAAYEATTAFAAASHAHVATDVYSASPTGKYLKDNGTWDTPGEGDAGYEWAFQEVPTGTQNGSNQSFTLAQTPAAAVVCIFNGREMQGGVDYSNTGTALTLITFAPNASEGDRFWARYPY